ncbi:hypothetical protein [Snuella lapsa]
MKFKHYILLVALTMGFVTKSFSQHKTYAITNGIGIFGGLTKFDIQTDNFVTKQGDGFLGGLSATVDIPHRWYNMSYGMQLSENYIHILGRTNQDLVNSEETFIEYKLFAAQLALLGHIKLAGNYFTIDAGPMVQYNGKLELKDKSQESYFINDFANVSATDIANISKVNFNGVVGATAGIKNFKLKAQYIYGFTNILKKLNTQEGLESENESFKGNQSMLVFGAMFCF